MLDDGERMPLVRKPPSRSFRQSCFAWRAFMDQRPLLLSALQASLGLLFFTHLGLTLLLVLSGTLDVPFHGWKLTRSLSVLPVLLLTLEVSTLCVALLVVIYSDFSKRRVRGVTVWQREAVGRILRNLVISLLFGVTAWLLYTRLTIGLDSVRLRGSLLGAFGGTEFLCLLSILKLALVRTRKGVYWLGVTLAALVFQGLLVCKVDYKATFPWYAVVFPLYGVLGVAAIHCVHSIYEFLSTADKEYRYAALVPIGLRLTAIFLMGASLIHIQQALSGSLEARAAAAYLLLASPMTIAALCVPIGSCLLDIVWGHVEMDFLHSKTPVGLARSRSV